MASQRPEGSTGEKKEFGKVIAIPPSHSSNHIFGDSHGQVSFGILTCRPRMKE